MIMPAETKTLGMVAFAAFYGAPWTEFGAPRGWDALNVATRSSWQQAGEAAAAWPSEATIPPEAGEPTPERPVYRKVVQAGSANFYMVDCNEGWRSFILCADMYEWAADWLVGVIQGVPIPDRMPDSPVV